MLSDPLLSRSGSGAVPESSVTESPLTEPLPGYGKGTTTSVVTQVLFDDARTV